MHHAATPFAPFAAWPGRKTDPVAPVRQWMAAIASVGAAVALVALARPEAAHTSTWLAFGALSASAYALHLPHFGAQLAVRGVWVAHLALGATVALVGGGRGDALLAACLAVCSAVALVSLGGSLAGRVSDCGRARLRSTLSGTAVTALALVSGLVAMGVL
jgi:hypothetical protein